MERVHITSTYALKGNAEGEFLKSRIAAAVAVYLLGRVVMFDAAAPFGLAFLAAYITFDKNVSWRYIAVAVMAFLGTVTSGAELSPVKYMLAFVLFGLIFVSVTTLTDRRSGFAVTSMAGVAMMISGVIFSAQSGPGFYDIFMLLIESFLCVVAANLLTGVMPLLLTSRGREYGAARTVEELAGIFLLCTLAVLGVSSISIGGVGLGEAAAAVLIMLLGLAGGMTGGAVGGIALGILFGLTRFPMAEVVGVFGVCGFACGMARRCHRVGVILAFFVANSAMSLYFNRASSGIFGIIEILIAVGLLCLTPKSVVSGFEKAVSSYGGAGSDKSVRFASQRLFAAASALSGVATTISEAVSTEKNQNFEDIATFFDKTADKVCKRCGLKFICWEKQFNATYDYMMKLTPTLVENGCVKEEDLAPPFRSRCIKSREFTEELSRLYGKHKIDMQWKHRLMGSKEIAAEQLCGMAKIVDKLASELCGAMQSRTAVHEKEAYAVSVGSSGRAKDGQTQSGDNSLCLPICGSKYVLIISDGMGSGSQAAGQSQTTVRLLEQLLGAGFDRQGAMKLINSVLLIRENEECFATIDVTVLDLLSGEAEFIKIGANATYIKHGGAVEEIVSSTLPAGILSDVDIETSSKRLTSGDYVVMLSDGVHGGTDDWMSGFLSSIGEESPQEVADRIMAEATTRKNGIAGDDMTVVVALLSEK